MRGRSLSLLAITIALMAPAHSAEPNRAQWAEIGIKYGASMIRMIAASTDTAIPPSTGGLNQQQAALRSVLNDYKDAQARMQGTMVGMRGTTQLAIDGTAALLSGSGVGAVPAIILKTTGQLATDALFDSMQKEVDTAVSEYLGSKRVQLLQIVDTSYEQLHSLPPLELKERLERSTTVLSDLRKLLPNDPNVQKMGETLVVEGIRNTQRATLERRLRR